MFSFRKVSSPEAFQKTIKFLKEDVEASGVFASEVVDMLGVLREVTILIAEGQ